MPQFDFTSPDGRKITVFGPEGATKEQAFAIAEPHMGETANAPAESIDYKSLVSDLFSSVPRGVVKGLVNTARNLGAAGQEDIGPSRPEAMKATDFPSTEEMMEKVDEKLPLPKPRGKAGEYGEAVGEALGAPSSWVGPGGLFTKAIGAAGGAIGSEALGDFGKSLGEGWEAAGKLFGGLLGGAAGARGGAAREGKTILESIPSQEELEKAAATGYAQLHAADVKFDQRAIEQLGNRAALFLSSNTIDDATAPITFKLLGRYFQELYTDPTIERMDHLRRVFNNWAQRSTEPTERLAARMVVGRIDDYLANPNPKELVAGSLDDAQTAARVLKNAQGNWAAAKKREMIAEALHAAEMQAARSGTGANSVNTMRQQISKIVGSEAKSRGFTQSEQDQMERIVLGTWTGNQLRRVGKMFAPTGLHSMAPAAIAGVEGGPLVGAAVAAGGFGAKALAERSTQRQIKKLDESIRSRAPLSRPIAARNVPRQQYLDTLVPAGAARSALEGVEEQEAPPGLEPPPVGKRSEAASPVMSDASPDPIRPGAQYAMADDPPPPTGGHKLGDAIYRSVLADPIKPRPLARINFKSAGAVRGEPAPKSEPKPPAFSKPAKEMTSSDLETWKAKARKELEDYISKVEAKQGKPKKLSDTPADPAAGRVDFKSAGSTRKDLGD